MVPSKSTTFVFCLVFISTSLNTSLAYTNQVTRKVVVEDDENGFSMTSRSSLTQMEHKAILNGGGEVVKGKMEGGRKMMVDRKDMKSKGKKKEEGESLTSWNGNSSSEYSSVGNNDRHKGQGKMMMRMQRKVRIRSTDSMKDNPAGGFMAFNADYHMARPHPPKNN